jgi:broad specificity phosphatase PhoE
MKRFVLGVLTLLIVAPVASLAAQATTVILVRHAEKASPTGDAGLTAVGAQRALDLAATLKHVELGAIITTQFQRTRLTAAPVAQASHLDPLIAQASGATGAHVAAVVRMIDSLPPGSTVLIVGHSNTLTPIIAALDGPTLANLCDAEHSTLFILQRNAPGQPASLVRARYGAAEPPEASQCP